MEQNQYTHHHDEAEMKRIVDRLSRAIGHLTAVKRMVEENQDCSEVLTQLAAVKSAVNHTIGDTGLQSLMVQMAGGENIFGDVEGQFVMVSWEDVIERDPEYIIVCDYYGEGYAEEKIEGLKTNPATMDMEAVKNDRFIIVPGLAMFPSLECMDAVELMAEGLHPDQF